MPPSSSRLLIALAYCAAALPASAITVTRVDVSGLPDESMAQNVRVSLSLNDSMGKNLSGRRLAYLLREAEAETREALEPFGYYSPTIVIQRSDRSVPEGAETQPAARTATADADSGEDTRTLTVSIRVEPGSPVRVRAWNVGVEGEAGEDAGVRRALASFAPRKGDVLDHTLYEASKSKVSRTLGGHGYFDADFTAHRVEVTRAENAADIDLRWTSGARYALGDAMFLQTPTPIIRDDLLQKLIGWKPGDAYDDLELERLRRSLVALDYFGLVEILPQPENAKDKVVPVQVNLTPAPRSIYSAGVNYGTRSGAGFSLGMERRYLNSRGHKALAQIDYASKRKTATVQYRVPAFAWLDGWYTASLQAADEQTDSLDNRRLEFVASRSGQYNDHLNLIASAHVLRERWSYFTPNRPITDYQYASFYFPSLRAEYIDVDDRLAPRRGSGGTLTLRGGKGGANGHATFAQLHATAQWFHGFDADSRLIVRGEAGHTFTGELLDLPPSLRYYAGGDRSIRGYGWREVGPRIVNSVGETYALGAPNVVTASVEYERYFAGPWGAAVFVDSGSAFNGKRPDMHTGVGIGLRWRSPVGPVRIDIARGLDSPDSPFTLHLNIGADL
ncbi:autotransporter assembly complex family protein [Thermomonas sp. HDW16]|uniref:autotransporter assembly complex protein TamA n=1 Tax=Thermomonas sp. HDW16 TaxID=2714945 RepID=UPI0014074304|nr:autotransporter assembly complex family protein [Thermomonas sp. HDW16]QIL19505.1 outer membrane protein assembly factor [Thermomonas sp. HDW16]